MMTNETYFIRALKDRDYTVADNGYIKKSRAGNRPAKGMFHV